MAPYNIHQQVFSLNMVSNITTFCYDTQAAVQKRMAESLQPAIDELKIGPWKVVWGPAVWKLNPEDNETSADHVWFVARNAAADWGDCDPRDTYVVSISGTAEKSCPGWEENLWVENVVDFESFANLGACSPPVPTANDAVDPSKAYIAFGAAIGVYRLLNAASPGGGTTLPQFLRNISAAANTRVVFTGHSLGGALSPTVALIALRSGMLDSISQGNTFAYPTAGPSPGNRSFATLFAESFPLIKSNSCMTDDPNVAAYQVWNANIWNQYDIVPHAWNIGSVPGQNLWDILRIYGPLPPIVALEAAAAIARVTSCHPAPPGIDYVPIQGSKLSPPAPPTPRCLLELLKIAGPQHGEPYKEIVGAPMAPLICEAPTSTNMPPVLSVIDDARKRNEEKRELSTSASEQLL